MVEELLRVEVRFLMLTSFQAKCPRFLRFLRYDTNPPLDNRYLHCFVVSK